MAAKNQRYDKPDLREKLKKKIQAGDKGGRPGQWSARKAQLLAQAYKKEGGGYAKKPSGAQKSLKRWTDEGWTTRDGKKSLREGGARRYLPKKAWDALSPKERREADATKAEGDAGGKQFVGNPKAAKSARRKVSKKKAKAGKKKTAKKKTARKKTSKKRVAKKGATKKRTGKKRVAKKRATKKQTSKKRTTKKRPGRPRKSPARKKSGGRA